VSTSKYFLEVFPPGPAVGPDLADTIETAVEAEFLQRRSSTASAISGRQQVLVEPGGDGSAAARGGLIVSTSDSSPTLRPPLWLRFRSGLIMTGVGGILGTAVALLGFPGVAVEIMWSRSACSR